MKIGGSVCDRGKRPFITFQNQLVFADLNECEEGLANCETGFDCVDQLGGYRCVERNDREKRIATQILIWFYTLVKIFLFSRHAKHDVALNIKLIVSTCFGVSNFYIPFKLLDITQSVNFASC